jgi:molybdate transport system substrate-binding protein
MNKTRSLYFAAFAALLSLLFPSVSRADEIRVAVAANFAAPMKLIAKSFKIATGHDAVLSFGSTGKFYAQIKNGAPFGIFLAADVDTPLQLEKENLTVIGSRFTYAIGKLVLWSAQPGRVDSQAKVLRTANFQHIAIASPKLAPYGAAAIETLTKLDLVTSLQPKLVIGESIGQTFNFISTGNAELGFVAMSQAYEGGNLKSGSAWIVPENYHHPIRQDAVLLASAHDNAAAFALIDYLKSEPAKSIMKSFGYDF